VRQSKTLVSKFTASLGLKLMNKTWRNIEVWREVFREKLFGQNESIKDSEFWV
jgi:hypothetical protein